MEGVQASEGGDLPLRPISAVPEARLRKLYAFWRGLAPEPAVPRRADMDPFLVPDLLPWLFVVDIEHDEQGVPHFRYRLAGTGITTLLDLEATGKYIHDVVESGSVDTIRTVYEWPLRLGRPVYSRTAMTFRGGSHQRVVSRLIAPMSRSGQGIDMYINVQHFEDGYRNATTGGPIKALSILDLFAVTG